MPSGKTHDYFNMISLAIIAIIAIIFAWSTNQFNNPILIKCFYLFIGSYVFSNFFLSPDLDLHKNRSKNNWGIFKWIWWPYSKFFKHRGLSHSIVFGTLTRVIYIYLFYFMAVIFYYFFGNHDYFFSEMPFVFVNTKYDDFHFVYLASLGIGIYLPAILHTLLDLFVSSKKKKRREKEKLKG